MMQPQILVLKEGTEAHQGKAQVRQCYYTIDVFSALSPIKIQFCWFKLKTKLK